MKYKLLPLKGVQSLKALNGFSALILGLNMIPEYAQIPFEEFFHSFKDRTPGNIETMIRKAVSLVQLSDDEIMSMVGFASDQNDIPISRENIKNLSPDDIFEIIVQVSLELSRININLVSEAEKKSSKTSPLTSGEFSADAQT